MTEIKRTDGPVSADAALALSGFRVAVAAEQRASAEAGAPYPVSDPDGHVTWVHPDGTRRTGTAPDSEPVN